MYCSMGTERIRSNSLRVAAQVRAEVARHQMPLAETAARLGVSRAAVPRRLLGQVPLMAGELPVIATLLGIPVEALIADDSADQVAS